MSSTIIENIPFLVEINNINDKVKITNYNLGDVDPYYKRVFINDDYLLNKPFRNTDDVTLLMSMLYLNDKIAPGFELVLTKYLQSWMNEFGGLINKVNDIFSNDEAIELIKTIKGIKNPKVMVFTQSNIEQSESKLLNLNTVNNVYIIDKEDEEKLKNILMNITILNNEDKKWLESKAYMTTSTNVFSPFAKFTNIQ